MALHSQHTIHRDLKPGNVMVSTDGRVVILDFGLVVELSRQAAEQGELRSRGFAGTLAYAAPEQLNGDATPASDWYAIGVMLYEALCGQRPLEGSFQEVFARKQTTDPPRLVGRRGIPQDLAELGDQLLTRDPADRPDALKIAEMLSVDLGSDSQESTDMRVTGDGFRLVGREPQLAALQQQFSELLAGRKPLSAFITGRSGEGKTSLASQFLKSLRADQEFLILSGRCYDRESVPFKALDSIIDAMVSHLRASDSHFVSSVLPSEVDFLATVFPLMRRVNEISSSRRQDVSGFDNRQVQQRAFAALRELLANIARITPVILFIDDLQWGDASSATVLYQLVSDDAESAILLLGTYRSDEANSSPFIAEWEKQREAAGIQPTQRTIKVGPLSETQCVTMVVARVGLDTRDIRRRAADLYHSTGGNPYFLEQLIDCFNSETGTFVPAPLDEVIERRMSKLPSEAGLILRLIAVSGQALPITEASLAADCGDLDFGTIARMSSDRVVRFVGTQERQSVDTYHDKIRETVLGGLHAQEKRDLHHRLGTAIETQVDIRFDELLSCSDERKSSLVADRVFDLAYHFEGAGDRSKTFVYSLIAAERAKGQFALDVARDKYEIAQRHADEITDRPLFRFKSGFAETLLLSGEFQAAFEMYHDARGHAENEEQQFAARAKQAEIDYKIKSISVSLESFQKLLGELGTPAPSTRWKLLWAVAWLSVRQIVRDRLLPKQRRAPRSPDWRTSLSIRLTSQLILTCNFKSPLKALWAVLSAYKQSQMWNVAESTRATCAMNLGSGACMMLGWESFGRKRFNEATRIASDLNDVRLLADACYMKGWGFAAVGRLDEAREELLEACTLYKKAGDVWRVTYATNMLASVRTRLGDCERAIEDAVFAFEQAVQYGQNRVAQSALEPWAAATLGRLPFSELRSCFQAVPDDPTTTIELLMAESWFHRGRGQTDKALAAAEQSLEIIKREWVLNFITVRALPNLAQALREHGDLCASTNDREARRLWRRGLKTAKWAVAVTRRLRCALPHSLRELSHAHLAFGRKRKAHKYAHESLRVARQQGAAFEQSQSLLVCGRVGQQLGLPEADQQISQATAWLSDYDQRIDRANRIWRQ